MEELGVHEGPTLRFTKRWLPHLRITRDGQALDLHIIRYYRKRLATHYLLKNWHLIVHLSGRDWMGHRYVRRVVVF